MKKHEDDLQSALARLVEALRARLGAGPASDLLEVTRSTWRGKPIGKRPARMTRRLEQQIQRAVFEHLRWHGAKNIFAFHPNGGWRTATEGAIFKPMGVVPGVPRNVVLVRLTVS